ncbi:hypothetical protein [Aquipseudomonas alcaligenes]|uniref:hypothetical protein n=1 Tax=Aquipseudomonas alcaligenes TaxID=43263 RepID=UPI0037485409
MSSYYFECKVFSATNEAKLIFELLKEASWNRDPDKQVHLKFRLGLPNDYVLPMIKFGIHERKGVLVLNAEDSFPSDSELCPAIARALDGLEGVRYKAVLFDSSSGGGKVWTSPEME